MARVFGYDDQYPYINASVHRRPAPQIAAPALTWQRGYWKPVLNPSTSTEDRIKSEKRWHRSIDHALLKLFLQLCPNLGKGFASPNLEGDHDARTLYMFRHKAHLLGNRSQLDDLGDDERAVRHEVFSIRTTYAGIKLVVHARLHIEYFTLLFAVDFSHNPSPAELPAGLSSIKANFDRLQELVVDRSIPAEDVYGRQISTAEKLLVEQSRQTIEQAFRDWVDHICAVAFATELHSEGPASLSKCGHIFADMVGVIFGLKLVSGAKHSGQTRLTSTFMPKKHEGRSIRIPEQVKGTPFLEHAPMLIDSIWPIIKWRNAERLDLEARHGKAEYTASLFQEGEVLHVSSLGRLLPNPKPEPIVYYLVCSYPSKWRLGRLIDQLHALETLRLAALRDLTAINDASLAINALAAKVVVSGVNSDTSNEFEEIGRSINIGLSYRVERSRNYVGSFNKLIETLEIGSVSGFQKYDDFVRRRVFDALDYIDRVGTRYDELRKHISFLFASRQQAAMTAHTAAMAIQSTETAKNTRVTNDLLRTAELFGVIPIAYYVSQITHEIALDALKQWPALSKIIPAGPLPYFVVGFAIGIGIAMFSHNARTKRPVV